MRLAYLCSDPGIPPDGHKGASVHFREMARALSEAGADLSVFMARAGSGAGFDPHPVRIVAPERCAGMAGELHQLAGSQAMLSAISKAGPHDGVYERLSLFGAAGLAYARASGVPFFVEVNAPLWSEAERFRSLHLRNTARALALDVMTGADCVLVVSRALAETVAAAGVDERRIEVVGNGVRGELFANAQPAPRPAALDHKPILLFVGSLKPWHGIDFLLRAFQRARRDRDIGLWVVGAGPLAASVQEAAERHPRDIVYGGAVPHELVPGLLKAADAVLAPYPEDAPDYFCPLKVVEALAAGRPLVASRTRCVLDVLAGEERPGLFRAGDEEDFARAVTRALDEPLGAGLRDRLADLSWEGKARRILRWFGRRVPAVAPGGSHA